MLMLILLLMHILPKYSFINCLILVNYHTINKKLAAGIGWMSLMVAADDNETDGSR